MTEPLAHRPPGTGVARSSTADRDLPLPELEALITEWAGHLNAADHRFLSLVAEFDRREGWADGGTRSCAHWLGWKCGIELGAAREKVRVARALEALPAIGAAMARGELSYSKVRALTRVATPATEDTLLMIALHGTAHHVEAVVRGYRQAREAAAPSREAQQHAGRSVRWHHDEDGSLVMQIRLPAEGGAMLLKALQRALDEDTGAAAPSGARGGVPAGTSATYGGVPAGTSAPDAGGVGSARAGPDVADTPSQRRADALVRFAESWLAHGDRALAGGERHQIVVHVDARMLASPAVRASDVAAAAQSAREPGRCGLDDGPSLSPETVRRLGCDASVVAIVHDTHGRTLDVGRRTRSIPPAIARALRTRDRGCRFPGCTHTRFVDGHHVEHWAHGGATRLSNLVLLCRRHHRQVHEGRSTVRVLDDGAVVFADALGRRIDAAPRACGSVDALIARHRDAGPPIDSDTAVGHWRGERLDLGMAVAGLCEQGGAFPERNAPRPNG